jgi:hypothetical protein
VNIQKFGVQQVVIHTRDQRASAVATPDLGSQVYWMQAKTEILNSMRAQKCQALDQVHQLVSTAIAGVTDFPPAVAKNLDTAAAAVKAAESQSAATFAQAVERFKMAVAGAVAKLRRMQGGQAQQQQLAAYGGELGGKIFDAILTGHTKPALKAFLDKFDADTRNCSYSERRLYVQRFLPEFLSIAAGDRSLVAWMSNSILSSAFGELMGEDKVMEDPVSSWPSWQTLMVQQFNAVLDTHWQDYRSSHPDHSFQQFLQSCPTTQSLEGNVISLPSADGKSFIEFDTQTRRGCWRSEQADSLGTHYTFDWSVNEGDDHMTFSEPYCIHSMLKGAAFIEQLGSAVADALDLGDPHTLDELKQAFLRVQYLFSHVSMYKRGQAAIAELLMGAIADHLGISLEWAAACQRPNPVPDQQALSKLTLSEYLDLATPQLTLGLS